MSRFPALLSGILFVACAAPQAWSATAHLKSGDVRFMKEAAQGNLAEIETGRLAGEKATNADVKKFAERMTHDHGQASKELADLASAKGVTLPATPGPSEKKVAQRLGKLPSGDFDRKYMGEMVKDHEKDVSEFRKMAKNARDPDLRSWVQKTLPVLEDHLKMAREVADATGAPRGARGSKSALMNPAR